MLADDEANRAFIKLVQSYLKAWALGNLPSPEAAVAWDEFFSRYDPLMRRYLGRVPLPAG